MNPGDFDKFARAKWEKMLYRRPDALAELASAGIAHGRIKPDDIAHVTRTVEHPSMIMRQLGLQDPKRKLRPLPLPRAGPVDVNLPPKEYSEARRRRKAYEPGSRDHIVDIRNAMQESSEMTPIALEDRLENYKRWKREKRLPDIDVYAARQKATGSTGHMYDVVRKRTHEKPIGFHGDPKYVAEGTTTGYHATGKKDVQDVVYRPRSGITERPFLIPGQPGVYHRGIFMFPETKENLSRTIVDYVDHPRRGLGRAPEEQAVIRGQIPSKYTIPTGKGSPYSEYGDYGELVIPAPLAKRYLTNVEVGGPSLLPPIPGSAPLPDSFTDMPAWFKDERIRKNWDRLPLKEKLKYYLGM